MASPNSSAPTTVPRDIEEKLNNFQSQVLLMILSYVNGKFQNTAPSLMEHLLKLERDSNSYSGIINYTFKRLKVNPMPFFTPDRNTVQLPQVKAEGIELRLALVNFIISFDDQQAAGRAIKNIAKEGSSLLAQQRTPLEIIEEVCKRRSFKDVVSISASVAKELNHAGFFDYLHDTDWLHNSDDVNQFLRKESGFSLNSDSEEMALFMTQKLSISDYTLISISKKLRGICQKHPKGAIFCISVPIAILAFLLVGVGISIGISYHLPISTDQSMEIGDIQSSSALIPVPNDVSSVSLNNPSKVTVFMASSIPPTGTRTLQSGIPSSHGHCAPYNVNNGNHPVYLLPGSIMNYDMTVSGLNSSQCPVQLVLLNNETEYLTCNYNSPNVVKAYCLTSGPTNISVMINESADYYVILIKKDLTISVSSDITVHQVYYNTSHLTTAKDCEKNDASCTVHNDDVKKRSCSNTEWYVILQSSSNVDVRYNYKTPSFNYCRLIVSLSSTLVIAIILLLALLIGCCLVSQRKKICNKCKGSGSGRNGSIQNNLPSHTGYAPIP